MPVRPSVLKLESALFTALKSAFSADPKVMVTGVHPRDKVDPFKNQCRLVTTQVSENMEGRVITRKILRPLLQIAIYTTEYSTNRVYQEKIIELIDTKRNSFITLTDQRVECLYIARRMTPMFEKNLELYVSSVDLQVHLAVK